MPWRRNSTRRGYTTTLGTIRSCGRRPKSTAVQSNRLTRASTPQLSFLIERFGRVRPLTPPPLTPCARRARAGRAT
eukprot:6211081-Pleurochrysis_carterae.AAC.6